MKRLFIGIPVKSAEVLEITEIWRNNEHLNPNVLKWVNPENWHITLVFLGDTPESIVDQLYHLMEESFSGIKSFSSTLIGVGVFPNRHNPKVIWLGFDNLNPLMNAQIRLVELLKLTGFLLDNKPLKPHLTLARVKNTGHRVSFESLLKQYHQSVFGTVLIHEIVLFESILLPGGPVYKPLFVKELE